MARRSRCAIRAPFRRSAPCAYTFTFLSFAALGLSTLPACRSAPAAFTRTRDHHALNHHDARHSYAGEIMHIVVIELYHARDVPMLIRESRTALQNIPGICFDASGPAIHVERAAPADSEHAQTSKASENHVENATVTFAFGFESVSAYREYIVHPDHVGLTQDWRDRIRSVTIHDFEIAESR